MSRIRCHWEATSRCQWDAGDNLNPGSSEAWIPAGDDDGWLGGDGDDDDGDDDDDDDDGDGGDDGEGGLTHWHDDHGLTT